MCGRAYSTYTAEELYFQYLNRKGWIWQVLPLDLELTPNFNICPSHHCPVLMVKDNTLAFRSMRWGLVPSWAKSIRDAERYSMINAKAEDIEQKRSYCRAFTKRRGIVPFSGFFEWGKFEDSKQPFAIYRQDQQILSMAAIWECWQDPTSLKEL
ncbi:MAG: SOS response-associated peptidase, partial [Bdellovibrionales bacterium]|nr:SOS response-associated peptidase [Bdellovibrionales bacterium]